ncbi:NMT-domain-containing protein [Jaminaea rosea]|uniref:Glycylpeptide N-tetradecanoyltransferase n=1 Tax=Jaminaea rosea TaxID=1569628 RepID=A0A316UQY2_9BASI|nr:NMT-domain-containing protein [Jaminaea rosea]PWN27198.1 NMT-domain-containing protein [Jaminaea rosea]
MSSSSSSDAPGKAAETPAQGSAAEVTLSPAAAPAEDVADAEEEGDDDIEGEEAPALEPGGTLTSKQRKKKKSKAAQKLKKKLGLNSNSDTAASSSSSSSAANPQVTPDMLSQVHSAVSAEHGSDAASKVNVKNLQEVLRLMTLERNATLEGQKNRGMSASVKQIKDHKFWKTQPVMKQSDAPPTTAEEEGPIEPSAPPEKVRQEPLPLPSDFEWVTIDIDNSEELKEVYELLSENYVEDDDASLRFNYSADFLHWVLKHPGYDKSWHVGVRVSSTRKLVAFISGIPHELRVRSKSFQSAEINFLCVHKKLRSKRLTPVLIKEVTRRCHLKGIFQAIYTVGAVLPTPMSCARYYHRTINAEKLLEIGFAAVPQGMSKERWIARYSLPKETKLSGLREMEEKDVPAVGKLLRRYLRRFDVAPRFTDEEVKHVLLSGNGRLKGGKQVVWTYVVEQEGRITDMASFYSLPSSVLDSKTHKTLEAAYLFYYATDAAFTEEQPASSASEATEDQAGSSKSDSLPAWQRSHLTSLSPSELADERNAPHWQTQPPTAHTTRLRALLTDILVLAAQQGFDVCNALTTLDNNSFLSDLHFGPGDGFLRWYLYNWRTRPICGGMGGRPGEGELDPAAKSAVEGGKSWSWGSGLGVAMV